MILSSLGIELKKLFSRPRTYLGLIGAGLIPLTIIIIFQFKDPTPFIAKTLGNMFTLSGSILNGYLVSLITLNHGTINFFLPVLIVLVVGELIAGECQEGTIRLLLSRPIQRYQLLTAKLISAVIYTLLLFLIMIAIGLGIGLLVFGQGSLFITGFFLGNDGWFNVLDSGAALQRLLMVYGASFLILLTVTSFSFFLSSILRNPITAIIFPLVLIIFFRIISAFPFLSEIKPYLFTTYMDLWVDLLAPEIPWKEIARSMSILIIHSGLFIAGSFIIFSKKDIIS